MRCYEGPVAPEADLTEMQSAGLGVTVLRLTPVVRYSQTPLTYVDHSRSAGL